MSVDHGEMDVVTVRAITDRLLQWKESNSSFFSDFNIQMNFLELSEALDKVILKEQKQTTDFVFFGTTSSGKSKTINCLLHMNLMRSGIGHTTPSAVWIKTTEESDSYFEYTANTGCRETGFLELNSERGLDDFHDIVDNNSATTPRTASCVHVFVSEGKLKADSMLSDKMAILDTPGMGQDIFDSEEVEASILKADVLVLVVDINAWVSKETKKLLKDKNFFVKPNVIFAVNKCDKLFQEREDRRRRIKENITNDILELTRSSRVPQTEEEVTSSTFFISSELAWKVIKSNCRELLTAEETSMMEEFNAFKVAVVSLARESRERKKKERIGKAVKRYAEEFGQELGRMKSEVDDVKRDIAVIQENIVASYHSLKHTLKLDFIKEIYKEHLKKITQVSANDKIYEFIVQCRNAWTSIFEDAKKTLFEPSMIERMNTFINRILAEEINEALSQKTAAKFHQLFSHRLEANEFEGSIYSQRIVAIKEEMNDLPTNYEEKLYELEAEYESKINEIKRESIIREGEIHESMQISEEQNRKGAAVAEAGSGLIQSAGGAALLARVGWAATAAGALGALLVAAGTMLNSAARQEQKSDVDRRLEERLLENAIEKLRIEKENHKKFLKIEKEKRLNDLQRELETNERQDLEERQQKVEELHTSYLQAFEDLYVHAIECVAGNVQQRLNEAVNNLDTMITACVDEASNLIHIV